MTSAKFASDLSERAGKVLLLDLNRGHAEALTAHLRSRNFRVDVYADPQQAIAQLRGNRSEYDIVILNVSGRSVPWPRTLQQINHACRRSSAPQRPLILCTSTCHQQPEFVLQIERLGARYVRER